MVHVQKSEPLRGLPLGFYVPIKRDLYGSDNPLFFTLLQENKVIGQVKNALIVKTML